MQGAEFTGQSELLIRRFPGERVGAPFGFEFRAMGEGYAKGDYPMNVCVDSLCESGLDGACINQSTSYIWARGALV